MPEVDGTKITVTKKTSVTKLDLVPTIEDNNQRQLFSRTPGLFVSEQQAATQFNLSYRGLGNPQESRIRPAAPGRHSDLDRLDRLPDRLLHAAAAVARRSAADPRRIEPALRPQSCAGGEPGVQAPAANQPLGAYTENVVGSDGLFSTYNTVEGSSGQILRSAPISATSRATASATMAVAGSAGRLYLAYRPTTASLWYIDLPIITQARAIPAGSASRNSSPIPSQAPTPFNHNWVRRTSLMLGNDSDLGAGWRVEAKLWATWQKL